MTCATPDRYTVRPAEGGQWTVWDTRRDQPVAGGEGLTERAARDLARRLSTRRTGARSASSDAMARRARRWRGIGPSRPGGHREVVDGAITRQMGNTKPRIDTGTARGLAGIR